MTRTAQGRLAVVFAVLALPTVWWIALATPPLQVADETQHILRAEEVGQGGLIARRAASGLIGDVVPVGPSTLGIVLDPLHGRTIATETRAMSCTAASLRWSDKRSFVTFANTAIYPPIFYLPVALAIDTGRILGWRVVPTLRMARVFNGTVAVTLATIALFLAGSGAPLLAVLLALPMTMSLFASCSQDAMLIATAAVVAAMMARRAPRRSGTGVLAFALGMLIAARPPYAALLPIPPLLAVGVAARRSALIASAIATVLALGWIVAGTTGLLTPTQAGGGLLTGAQMQFLRHHPLSLPQAIARTLIQDGGTFFHQFIGILGWLDLELPGPVYTLDALALLAGVVLSLPGGRHAWSFGGTIRTAAAAACVGGAALLVFILQYLSWTAVGAPQVAGVQGRYFIPLAMAATALAGAGPLPPRRLLAATMVTLAMLSLDLAAIPRAIDRHYDVMACQPAR